MSPEFTAAVHGGSGSIRQGIMRKLVVRFELGEGLHIYGEPVPQGMVATQVSVSGPPGFTALDTQLPPTQTLHLESMGVDLEVWGGTVDIVVPFYAKGELASETRPLDAEDIDIEVRVRYQACTDTECLLPRTETFKFTLKMDVIDVPKLSMHVGHGQREGSYDSKNWDQKLGQIYFLFYWGASDSLSARCNTLTGVLFFANHLYRIIPPSRLMKMTTLN